MADTPDPSASAESAGFDPTADIAVWHQQVLDEEAIATQKLSGTDRDPPLSVEQVDSLLRGVTGEENEPPDDWAAAMTELATVREESSGARRPDIFRIFKVKIVAVFAAGDNRVMLKNLIPEDESDFCKHNRGETFDEKIFTCSRLRNTARNHLGKIAIAETKNGELLHLYLLGEALAEPPSE